jgi:signal transduction histidine kinase
MNYVTVCVGAAVMCIMMGIFQALCILLMYVALRSRREMFLLHLRTIRLESEATLNRVRAEAHQQMVAATAHDLKTPLSAIQSGCRVLAASAKKCSPVDDQVFLPLLLLSPVQLRLSAFSLESHSPSLQLIDQSASGHAGGDTIMLAGGDTDECSDGLLFELYSRVCYRSSSVA